VPEKNRITKSSQLLVEGRDAEAFFYPFLEDMSMSDAIEIQNYGGVNELRGFLRQFVISSDFKDVVTSIGIIRDAEDDPGAAFQSVCDTLEGVGLAKPVQPTVAEGEDPKVNVLILPDASSRGMLETLLLRAVEHDPATKCIDQFLECVNQETNVSSQPEEKAKVLAFLASRPRVLPLIGYAARAGYWQFQSSAYDHVREFIGAL
jgi:hypothetical protein